MSCILEDVDEEDEAALAAETWPEEEEEAAVWSFPLRRFIK